MNSMIKEKGEVEKKYEKQLVTKDAETGKLFGTLASQAQSIAVTTPASDTIKHFDTAKTFMDLYGGTITDSGLAWNTTFINTQKSDYELIKAQLETTRKENEKLQKNLEKTSTENVQLTGKLSDKAVELEKTVGKVAVIENTLYAQKGWAAKLKSILYISVVLTIIGGLCYIRFHIWQLKQKNKDITDIRDKLREEAERRRQATREKFNQEAEAKELKSSVKAFMSVDNEGNVGLKRILRSNGLRKQFEDFKDVDGKTIDED